ncbi:MAG: potassium channel family protein [Spirosomataceae bacterium]
MKYIVIGLGNFGSTLAMRLTATGHEVFGVDSRMEIVELYKDKITHTICLDTSKEKSFTSLPIKETDVVVVAIGEDVGASIITTAMLKQKQAKRIIGRSINDLHEKVLEAIGLETIFNPEKLAAELFAKQLEVRGVIESFDISEDCSILEVEVPERYLGTPIGELNFQQKYNLKLIALKHFERRVNLIGKTTKHARVDKEINPNHILDASDILVLMGSFHDFEKMVGKNNG